MRSGGDNNNFGNFFTRRPPGRWLRKSPSRRRIFHVFRLDSFGEIFAWNIKTDKRQRSAKRPGLLRNYPGQQLVRQYCRWRTERKTDNRYSGMTTQRTPPWLVVRSLPLSSISSIPFFIAFSIKKVNEQPLINWVVSDNIRLFLPKIALVKGDFLSWFISISFQRLLLPSGSSCWFSFVLVWFWGQVFDYKLFIFLCLCVYKILHKWKITAPSQDCDPTNNSQPKTSMWHQYQIVVSREELN